MREHTTLSLTPEERKKLISIEFLDGFKDGEVYKFPSNDKHEMDMALSMYLGFSARGTLGKRLKCLSDAGLAELLKISESMTEDGKLELPPVFHMNNIYEVVERIEDSGTIRVIYKYMGKE
ncbi:MAG: hypothetical protein SFX72_20795 [Isosphaeraceae bacterium]|nr:hypothetical protein [Isosphaeraceae bacterium]